MLRWNYRLQLGGCEKAATEGSKGSRGAAVVVVHENRTPQTSVEYTFLRLLCEFDVDDPLRVHVSAVLL